MQPSVLELPYSGRLNSVVISFFGLLLAAQLRCVVVGSPYRRRQGLSLAVGLLRRALISSLLARPAFTSTNSRLP